MKLAVVLSIVLGCLVLGAFCEQNRLGEWAEQMQAHNKRMYPHRLPQQCRCEGLNTRDSCVKNEGCGWCETFNTCMRGNSSGPVCFGTYMPCGEWFHKVDGVIEVTHSEVVLSIIGAVSAVLVGWTVLLFGYRLFYPVLFLSGFIPSSILAYNYLYMHIIVPHLIPHSAGIVGGVLGLIGSLLIGVVVGGIVLLVVRLGLFLVGGVLGVMIASTVFVLTDYDPTGTTRYSIFIVCAVVFGVLAMVFQKFLVVLATSCGGAYGITTATYYFTNYIRFHNGSLLNNNFSKILFGLVQHHKLDTLGMPITWIDFVMLGGLVLLAILGIVVQMQCTGKSYTHHRESVRVHTIQTADIEAAPLLAHQGH